MESVRKECAVVMRAGLAHCVINGHATHVATTMASARTAHVFVRRVGMGGTARYVSVLSVIYKNIKK